MSFVYARHFTPAEADAMLPSVRRWLGELREEAREVQRLREQLREGAGPIQRVEEDIEARRAVVSALIGRFRDEGVEVKGIDPGLVDFPALLQGREVLLCWREPELSVAHWHPTTTGFSGRQPIDAAQRVLFEWCN